MSAQMGVAVVCRALWESYLSVLHLRIGVLRFGPLIGLCLFPRVVLRAQHRGTWLPLGRIICVRDFLVCCGPSAHHAFVKDQQYELFLGNLFRSLLVTSISTVPRHLKLRSLSR